LLLAAACNECSVQQSTVVAAKLLMCQRTMTLLSGVLLFQGQVVVGGSVQMKLEPARSFRAFCSYW
jgi:hypothetical protein